MNPSFSLIILLTSLVPQLSLSFDSDVKCLQGVKSSLSDPQNRLTTWHFDNTSVDSICRFTGVACWNEKEDRLLSLSLESLSLSGEIPPSLQYCKSLQSLTLSGNRLTGEIPRQICDWLPYIVTLDLSGNSLTGSIPSEIENCKFLNSLDLSDNELEGSVPSELGRLGRLKRLSVSGNKLEGVVPAELGRFGKDAFSGNDGLCGEVVGSKCGGGIFKVLIIVGSVMIVLFVFGVVVWWWWCWGGGKKEEEGGVEGGAVDGEKGRRLSGWVGKLGRNKGVQVVFFQKPIVKIRVVDLLVGTSGFNDGKVVNTTKTGVSYQAVLGDGSVLAVKRLRGCKKVSDKEFKTEVARLGKLRHPNLVPLLGYCVVEDEKLVVYKDMSNGTLYSWLHPSGGGSGSVLDWRARVRISVGVARGLAWLHHGCTPGIMHQTMCSNVILLDDDFDVRITEFGLVRLMGTGHSNGSSVANGDFGEFGYVPPEYASTLVASLKGDVYGFGVVLLELITRQKPLEVNTEKEGFKGSLVHWVTYLSSSGRIKDAIDKSLCGKGNDDEIMQLLRVACSCVASRPKDRPSMFRVYESLKNLAEKHGCLEQCDEFPMILDVQDND